MKSLLIVYHSATGGTASMVEAAARAARQAAAIEVQVLYAQSAGAEHVLAADGYVFATPETLAGMAGLVKDFFDRTYYGVLDRINGRPYAVMVCAGSDGSGAVRQIERIATGWRLRPAASPLIVCTHAQQPAEIMAAKRIPPDELARCEELGATIALGMEMGLY